MTESALKIPTQPTQPPQRTLPAYDDWTVDTMATLQRMWRCRHAEESAAALQVCWHEAAPSAEHRAYNHAEESAFIHELSRTAAEAANAATAEATEATAEAS